MTLRRSDTAAAAERKNTAATATPDQRICRAPGMMPAAAGARDRSAPAVHMPDPADGARARVMCDVTRLYQYLGGIGGHSALAVFFWPFFTRK